MYFDNKIFLRVFSKKKKKIYISKDAFEKSLSIILVKTFEKNL